MNQMCAAVIQCVYLREMLWRLHKLMRIENENILFFNKAKGTTLQIPNYYGHGNDTSPTKNDSKR